MKRPEQALQMAVASFLRVALRPPTIWTAFPAGGGGRVRGAFLKAMGLQAGWPDILVIHPIPTQFGPSSSVVLGLELKSPKGKFTVEQKRFAIDIKNAGGSYGRVWSVEDVERLLRERFIPLHATTITMSAG